MMNKNARVYVAGHSGLVGAAVCRILAREKFNRIIVRTRRQLDLTSQAAVERFFKAEKPDYVFLFAARVGGIQANNRYPVEFLYENLMISANVIHAAYRHGARKLLYLGSSCMYPAHSPQPIPESALFSGAFEPTNEAYALAKVAGLKLCQYYQREYAANFICLVPPNLFGPGDDFDPETSHVIPALIRKFLAAVESGSGRVELWGSGRPRREFLFVDDAAHACCHFMGRVDSADMPGFVNIGSGADVSIKELAGIVAGACGFTGRIAWDTSKPDGMLKKSLDASAGSRFGWKAKTSLDKGIRETVRWYRANRESIR